MATDREVRMPLVEVKIYDRRVTPEASEKIIKEMTDALCRAVGDEVREHTSVIVTGVPANQWGTAGQPGG